EEMTLNSAVYYAIEYLELAKNGNAPFEEHTLRRLVQNLSGNVHIETSTDLRCLDTLCRAFVYLRMLPEATRAAQRVAALIERIEPLSFGHDERDMLRYAQGVFAVAQPRMEHQTTVER